MKDVSTTKRPLEETGALAPLKGDHGTNRQSGGLVLAPPAFQ